MLTVCCGVGGQLTDAAVLPRHSYNAPRNPLWHLEHLPGTLVRPGRLIVRVRSCGRRWPCGGGGGGRGRVRGCGCGAWGQMLKEKVPSALNSRERDDLGDVGADCATDLLPVAKAASTPIRAPPPFSGAPPLSSRRIEALPLPRQALGAPTIGSVAPPPGRALWRGGWPEEDDVPREGGERTSLTVCLCLPDVLLHQVLDELRDVEIARLERLERNRGARHCAVRSSRQFVPSRCVSTRRERRRAPDGGGGEVDPGSEPGFAGGASRVSKSALFVSCLPPHMSSDSEEVRVKPEPVANGRKVKAGVRHPDEENLGSAKGKKRARRENSEPPADDEPPPANQQQPEVDNDDQEQQDSDDDEEERPALVRDAAGSVLLPSPLAPGGGGSSLLSPTATFPGPSSASQSKILSPMTRWSSLPVPPSTVSSCPYRRVGATAHASPDAQWSWVPTALANQQSPVLLLSALATLPRCVGFATRVDANAFSPRPLPSGPWSLQQGLRVCQDGRTRRMGRD